MSSITTTTTSNNDPTDVVTTTTPSIVLDTTTRDNIETNVYLTNLVQQTRTDWMELPASYDMSRRRFPETTTTKKFEIVLGRLAMMGAVIMALREWNDGSSIIEQVMTTLVAVP